MKKVSFIVVGGGSRGSGYARYALDHPDEAEVVGVCEPRVDRRQQFAIAHSLTPEQCFNDWRELLDRPRLADAAFICTVEDTHRDIAVALADKGYQLLLEKPMAPTAEECHDIYAAVKRNNTIVAVCHVLRYVEYIQRMKSMIDSGLIGNVRHISATEYVGPWHFSHSFVRGIFRNEEVASPFLLAKCCHDMDLLRFLMGVRCVRVHSFGRLSLFKRENQPEGAADRCTECPPHIESLCPYSALKIYLRDRFDRLHQWPVAVLTTDTTPAGVARALEEGPYGRCVWACDNDVADHQVVNLEFENGSTASFATTAFADGGRDYYVMGDTGSIRMDNNGLLHHDFLTGRDTEIPLYVGDNTPLSGHGGGDEGVVHSFLSAVRENDPGLVSTGPEVSLETHLIVFAAEKSRHNGTVETVPQM